MIQVKNLSKTFPEAKGFVATFKSVFIKAPTIIALDGVDFSVDKGEVFTLLGPNGAGKTTIMRIIATLLTPTRGFVSVNGHDVVKSAESALANVSYVLSEERSHYLRLTGKQNLEFFAALNGLSAQESILAIDRVLDVTDLVRNKDMPVSAYSSGMRQRLSLARGLLKNPSVILLDEPTRGLDPPTAEKIRNFVLDVLVKEHKTTVILSTHNLAEAEHMSDRLALLHRGQIKASGSVDEIKSLLGEAERYEIVVEMPKQYALDTLTNHPSVVTLSNDKTSNQSVVTAQFDDSADLSTLIETIYQLGGKVRECSKKEARLEDIFSLIEAPGERNNVDV